MIGKMKKKWPPKMKLFHLATEKNDNSNVIVEEAVDRMRLRQREPAPIPVVSINLLTFIRTNI
jgi:hypothetical protein